MSRSPSTFRRALALFLACQPVLWMSNVALAQSLDPRAGAAGFPGLAAGAAEGRGADGIPAALQPQVQVPGQAPGQVQAADPTRTPDRAPTPQPVDEPIDPERYVLGPGDVLELRFWGIENFKLRVPVDLEGRAFVAKIGYLPLQGKTLAEAQRTMRTAVARFFPRLEFGVTLVEPRTFLVQVVDAVNKPGSYPARAIDRVATVLQRSGGLLQIGSTRRVEIQRRDGSTVRADLLLYALTGDVKHNPYVLDGDVVRVPFQQVVAEIGGAVNRPGRYELTGSMDLAELVELAGGTSPRATTGLPVRVIRRAPDARLQQLTFDFTAGGKLPAVAIDRGDDVRIPGFEELEQSVTVTGALAGVAAAQVVAAGTPSRSTTTGTGSAAVASDEAAATRRVPYARGETVRTLLDRVGGVGPLADLKGAFILRSNQAVPVDLYELLMLRNLQADKAIELGDTLVVPFRRPSVLVEGAVFKPGPYPYNPTYGVEQYLALAGGLTRFAQDMDDVYLVTPTGQMKEFAPDLKVEPGASLVVPERSFSRAEVVGLIIAGASLLLSAATIYVTLRK